MCHTRSDVISKRKHEVSTSVLGNKLSKRLSITGLTEHIGIWLFCWFGYVRCEEWHLSLLQ